MLSDSSALEFVNVSKRYILGTWQPGPIRRLRQWLRNSANDKGDLWALQDVTFSVQPGEVLGIIGNNGAGKTTILKILAGVTKPTQGDVYLKGKVSALIELGAGFHPELTGRENIYLNGATLGMKRRQIDLILDEIIAFAELERFIDTPIKRYSSGMYARLGFSVAVHVDPDVLIVDEVLSVGDIAFQQKSLQRMLEFKSRAKALVFVSHNMIAIQRICSRVLWLDNGSVVMSDRPNVVVERYRSHSAERLLMRSRKEEIVPVDHEGVVAQITGVELLGSCRDSKPTYRVGDELKVRLSLYCRQPLTNIAIGIAFYRHDGIKLGEASNLFDGITFDNVETHGEVTFNLPQLFLTPGTYYINVSVSDGYLVSHDHVPYAAQFSVEGVGKQNLQHGPLYMTGTWWYSSFDTPKGS